MNSTATKIRSVEATARTVSEWKKEGKVVFTNGCFDMLHLGHIDYLEKARNLGFKLIVALNSDASVRRLKGEERPINNQETRSRIMAALEFVDAVILFEADTPLEVIAKLKPDILVKGGDYDIKNIIGADIVIENRGQVLTIPFLEGYSTTQVISKIKNKS